MVQAHAETFLPTAVLPATLDIEAAIQAAEQDTGAPPATWRQRLGAFLALVQSKLDRSASTVPSPEDDGDTALARHRLFEADSAGLSAGPAHTQS